MADHQIDYFYSTGVSLRKSRRDIFHIWLEKKGQNNNIKRQHVIDSIISNLKDNVAHEIKKDISRCCSEIAKRWQNYRRIES
jgi:uncharacterized protein (DUF2267 family)